MYTLFSVSLIFLFGRNGGEREGVCGGGGARVHALAVGPR
jgi:hypothetical protein